jgi:Smg protein
LRERVLAIVSFIAQYFLDDQDMLTESDLVEELLAVGFDADEIDAAFSWMESQTLSAPATTTSLAELPQNYRVFSAEEIRILSAEARGFLCRLFSMGFIDTAMQEEVISRAIQAVEDEVSLKDIKTITVLAMFANSHNEWRSEYDCLLEDDWSRLMN